MRILNIVFFCFILLVEAVHSLSETNLKHCIKCVKKEKKFKIHCKKCPATRILNNLNILTPEETVNEIIYKNKSIARFGDVEFDLIFGIDKKDFQNTNKNLTERLKDILRSDKENILIGLPSLLKDNYRKLYTDGAQIYWENWINRYKYQLINLIDILDKNKKYGYTEMSRFYINYKDRTHAGDFVKKLKMIWDNKDIVMIEGEKTRLGVGNDLFNNTKSIQRILCPNSNAYNLYDKIYNEAIKVDKSKLILLALGPTATILAYDLNNVGYQAIDIGHVDIEYEWYLRNATYQIKIENKHTYEAVGGTVNISDTVT